MTTVAVPRHAVAREPLWTRNYILTLLSMHLFFLTWSALFNTLPLYLADARKWQVGWVVGGAVGVASVSVRIISGRVADRAGRRRCMVAGGALAGLLMAAQALTNDPLLLTPIRVVFALGTAFYTTAAMAMLADLLPPSRRGEGMGWYGVIYTATNVYGPWLGLAVADALGLRPFFVLNGLVLLACAAVSALIQEQHDRYALAGRATALISRAALLPTSTFIALAVTFSALPAFLALYARGRDLGNPGLFFFILGITLMAARWFGGAAADRFSRAAVIIPGLVLATAALALLAFAAGPPLFYLAAAVFGAGFGLGHTGLTILTMDRAPPSERGAAMATFTLAWDIGTLGAFALGFIADALSLRALFAVAAVLPLLALAGFQAGRKR